MIPGYLTCEEQASELIAASCDQRGHLYWSCCKFVGTFDGLNREVVKRGCRIVMSGDRIWTIGWDPHKAVSP